jgi:hypothetical protein
MHTTPTGIVTRGRQILLAETTLSARDAEGVDDAVAGTDVLHPAADGFDNADELVAQDVALLELEELSVEQVHVGAADGAAGYADDGVVVVDDGGFGGFLWVVLA